MRTVMILLVGLIVGCGKEQPKGPTYNEALQIYENEQKELERLEGKSLRLSNAEYKVWQEELKHEPLQLALEKSGTPNMGTVESRQADRDRRKAIYKTEHDETGKEIDAQRPRVKAAKKLVDELRKSK